MRRTRLFILALFLSFNAWPDSSKVFITGHDLLDYCQQSSNFCFGFVTAVVDDTSLTYGEKTGYCLPAAINAEALQEAVIRYMETHEQVLQFPGASVVVLALKYAYPCQ